MLVWMEEWIGGCGNEWIQEKKEIKMKLFG